jgi:tRNA-splicing ligase RtcB
MELAGRYAYAGREWVVERVRRIVGGAVTDTVHNHHNYAWREKHNGRDLWVVRKGATPAFPGQRGFVGGSMGDDAVIIEGVESPSSFRVVGNTPPQGPPSIVLEVVKLKEKLHEAEHHSRMRASPDGSRCLDGVRVSSQLPKLPNKKSRDRRLAERKCFVEHRRDTGLLDR